LISNDRRETDEAENRFMGLGIVGTPMAAIMKALERVSE
jgi:hypothetical protein